MVKWYLRVLDNACHYNFGSWKYVKCMIQETITTDKHNINQSQNIRAEM